MLPSAFTKVWFWVAFPLGLWTGITNGLWIGLAMFWGISIAPQILYKLFKIYKSKLQK